MSRTGSVLFCVGFLSFLLCNSCSSRSQQVTPPRPAPAPAVPAGPLAQVDLGGKVLPDKIAITPWWPQANPSPAGGCPSLVFSFNDTAKEPTVVPWL